jgi:methionyl-tRNA formyltransferase
MRIVFCGTPDFAVPSLRRLLAESAFTVQAVVTQPDRPRGRGQALSAPAVKQAALEAGLQVFQPEKIKSDEAHDFFLRIEPDAVVIIAYGQIVSRRLIDIPRLGWINLHASLLPRYRGAAPIAWALVNGESKTGLTTMQIDSGMDTGPLLLQQEMEIGANETAPELSRRMAEAGAPLMVESLLKLDRGAIQPHAQDASQATYAPIIKKENGRIDWSRTAHEAYNRIRGLAPWPGAYTSFRGRLCHLWGKPAEASDFPPDSTAVRSVFPGTIEVNSGTLLATCGHGTALAVESLQMEGRKRVSAAEFLNGARLAPGERFGG